MFFCQKLSILRINFFFLFQNLNRLAFYFSALLVVSTSGNVLVEILDEVVNDILTQTNLENREKHIEIQPIMQMFEEAFGYCMQTNEPVLKSRLQTDEGTVEVNVDLTRLVDAFKSGIVVLEDFPIALTEILIREMTTTTSEVDFEDVELEHDTNLKMFIRFSFADSSLSSLQLLVCFGKLIFQK